jgi:hypothetical protein
MAKAYRTRPSQLLGLNDPYLAYCLDEVALWLTVEATDKEGRLNLDRVKWKDRKPKSNTDFINFVQGQK